MKSAHPGKMAIHQAWLKYSCIWSSMIPQLQLSFVLSLDDSMFIQMFEARKILEVGIVALAAQKITVEDIAELKINLEKSKAVVENDPTAFLQTDVELHPKNYGSGPKSIFIENGRFSQ